MNLYAESAVALLAQLEAGATTSVAIVEALRERAAATEPRVNALSQPGWEEALRTAAERDAERRRGMVRGLLHGLPFTVKDNIDAVGFETTVGLKEGGRRRPAADAIVVQLMREAGAIVLGKTNVPQALLSMRCDNALYGPTSNPWSAAHVTGGSSSGEGAAIASGISPVGFGSDLGGSIRFPAAFCGVVGFKPTLDRWSNLGVLSAIPGQAFVRAQIGPLARTVADVSLLFAALPSERQAPLDRRVPPLPTMPLPADLRGVRIGWFEHDGFLEALPGCVRAVRLAREALADAGAELVSYTPRHQREMVLAYIAATSSDGLATLRRGFGREPVPASLKLMWRVGTAPRAARRAAEAALALVGEHRLADTLRSGGRKAVAELWQLTDRLAAMAAEIESDWRTQRLDAVICPAGASPAVPIGMERDASIVFSYFGRYNLLGMPAGVVPVTRVRSDETDWSPPSGRADRFDKRLQAIAAHSAGLPVAVQVAAPRWRDETALAVMAAIEARMRGRDDFPQTPRDPSSDGDTQDRQPGIDPLGDPHSPAKWK